MDRPPRRVAEDERFEFRLREVDDSNRYASGPPARRPERYYEDEHLVYSSGPLVTYDGERRRSTRNISPSGGGGGGRPRLVRRQSSLDTFDRIPPRRRDPIYQDTTIPIRSSRGRAPASVSTRRSSPPPPATYYERDYYEDIRIAEPDYYGDEEFRDLHETQQQRRRRRSSSNGNARYREKIVEEIVEEKVEKPYPRKGKTRMPRRLVHPRAIDELGYPFIEEVGRSVFVHREDAQN